MITTTKLKFISDVNYFWGLLSHLWILWLCFFKFCGAENDFPQDSHLKSLRPSWTVWMCFLIYTAWENDLPQDSHLKSLRPPWWTIWLCCFKFSAWENDLPQDAHKGDLFCRHELFGHVFSNFLLGKMICHKIHTCLTFYCDEPNFCGVLLILLKLCGKYHIC